LDSGAAQQSRDHRDAPMNDQQSAAPDPVELARSMARIAERSQRLLTQFAERAGAEAPGSLDPLNITGTFREPTRRLMSDPVKLMQAQVSLWQDYMNLWQTTAQRMMGQNVEPVIAPAADDRRFKHEGWQNNEIFDFIKQSYLLTARWMQATVEGIDGVD